MKPWGAARKLSTDITANYGGQFDLSSQAAVVNAVTCPPNVQHNPCADQATGIEYSLQSRPSVPERRAARRGRLGEHRGSYVQGWEASMKEDTADNIAQRLEMPYVPLGKETTEERVADALEYIAYRLYKIDAKLGAMTNK
jgi:hypothetical protein